MRKRPKTEGQLLNHHLIEKLTPYQEFIDFDKYPWIARSKYSSRDELLALADLFEGVYEAFTNQDKIKNEGMLDVIDFLRAR